MSKIRTLFNSLLFRLILSYSISICAAVVTVSGLYTHIFADKYLSEMEQKSTIILEQFRDNVDRYVLRTVDDLIVHQLSGDMDITRLFRYPLAENYIYVDRVYNKLCRQILSSGILDSAYIYYLDNRLVISSGGSYFLDSKNPRIGDIGWLVEGDLPADGKFQLLQIHSTEEGKPVEKNIISYSRNYPLGTSGKYVRGCISLNIQADVLYDQAKHMSEPLFGDLYVLDENGYIIAPVPAQQEASSFLSGISLPDLMGRDSGYLVYDEDGQKYCLFFETSRVNGFKFLCVVPMQVYGAQIRELKQLTLLIGLAAVAIPLLFVLLWVRKLTHPLRSLVRKSQEINEWLLNPPADVRLPKRKKDEELLGETFSGMEKYINRLETRISEDEAVVRNNLLSEILRSHRPHEEIKASLDERGIALPWRYYWCICFTRKNRETLDPSEIPFREQDVCRAENVKHSSECCALTVSMMDENLYMLVNAERYESVYALAEDICNELGESVAATIGTCAQDIGELHHSYQISQAGGRYVFIYPDVKIFEADAVERYEQNKAQLPYTLIEALEGHLNQSSPSDVQRDIERIFAFLKGSQLSYQAVNNGLFEILRILHRRMSKMNIHSQDIFDFSLNQKFEQLNSIEQARQFVLSLCERLLLLQRENQSRKVSDGLGKICDYIVEKIYAGESDDLSLVQVAEVFHKNPNYLSTVFSEQLNTNFKDFVMEVKLRRAEEEMHREGVKITDLAAELGYQNVSYFIKVFKRRYGCTPKQYYDSLHGKKQSGT